MEFKKAKDKLKNYLIFTGILWIGLPIVAYIIINIFEVSGESFEALLQGMFGVLGLYWIYDTIMSIKPVFILIKSGKLKDIFKSNSNESNNSNNNEPQKKVVDKSKVSDGEQVVRNFSTVILIILAIMLLVNLVSI